ncbi:MAG: hypothetical protein HQL67_12185 [Magnetococcales bacterium]|nr:hypothetical protein [Magnetococcales bacterium]
MTALQPIKHNQSNYERPEQKRICNRRDGSSCRQGPKANGRCGADFSCQPIRRGDRWFCTRSNGSGEPCERGPNPDGTCSQPEQKCHPRHSIRDKRGWWGRGLLLFGLGLAFMILGSQGSNALFSPGKLTAAHSAIQSCSECHGIYDKGLNVWFKTAFGQLPDEQDDKRCLVCHKMGPNFTKAHGMEPNRLADRSSPAAENDKTTIVHAMKTGIDKLIRPLPDKDQTITCGTCHREHRGRSHLLVESSDRPFCNTCHQEKIDQFPDDHPPFPKQMGQRPQSILFDHASHLGKHFLGKDKIKAPKNCTDCHTADQGGGNMQTVGYSPACDGCHSGEVAGDGLAGFKGFPVFSVPGLDLETLHQANMSLGSWPEDSEEELSPFMAFLLSTDPTFQKEWAELSQWDLIELPADNLQMLAQVQRMGWQVKELWEDLLLGGQNTLEERLHHRLPTPVSKARVGWISGLLSADNIAIGRQWFPQLSDELVQHRNGVALPLSLSPAPQQQSQRPAPSSDLDSPANDELLGGDENSDLLNDEGSDELLGGDENSDLLNDEGSDELLGGDENSDLLNDEGSDELLTDDTPANTTDPNQSAAADSPVRKKAITGEAWSPGGGWFRHGYALYYRPTGHGDLFLKNWLELSGQVRSSDSDKLFKLLTSQSVPGACIKCHRVSEDDSANRIISWKTVEPKQGIMGNGFSRFSHAPHLNLGPTQNCQSCHALQRSGTPESVAPPAPSLPSPGFAPLGKTVCAQCHTPGKAEISCRSCHNYHIGDFNSASLSLPASLR